jgi:hypothetical protein
MAPCSLNADDKLLKPTGPIPQPLNNKLCVVDFIVVVVDFVVCVYFLGVRGIDVIKQTNKQPRKKKSKHNGNINMDKVVVQSANTHEERERERL